MLKNPSTEKINWNNAEIYNKFNEKQKIMEPRGRVLIRLLKRH